MGSDSKSRAAGAAGGATCGGSDAKWAVDTGMENTSHERGSMSRSRTARLQQELIPGYHKDSGWIRHRHPPGRGLRQRALQALGARHQCVSFSWSC